MQGEQSSVSKVNNADSSITGSSGTAASFESEFATWCLSGFVEGPTTLPDIVAQLGAYIDDPTRCVAQIRSWPGNYALAISLCNKRGVYLIADELGSQPLYYARTKEGWAWSFELKHLVPFLGKRKLDYRGLDEIFYYRWLMEDHTLLADVAQVLPSHCVYLEPGKLPHVVRYVRQEFHPSESAIDEESLINRTNEALDIYFKRLRKRHTRVAILLSGGVDSSLLVAKARNHDFPKLIAVTGRFPDREDPETERAVRVAHHLGIEHRIIDIPESFIEDFAADLVWQLERPPSYLNTFVRAKIFRDIASEVDVVLTGEAADCLFSNETSFTASLYDKRQRALAGMPAALRRTLAAFFAHIPLNVSRRFQYVLSRTTLDFVRRVDATPWEEPRISAEELVPSLRIVQPAPVKPFYTNYEPDSEPSLVARCHTRGLYTSNRNQFYCYSMLAAPHGLSVEFPFLSKEVAQIGFSLPDALRSDALGPKPILKKLALRYIPADVAYASKMQFETPDEDLLRGPLSRWRSILLDDVTAARGLYDQNVVRKLDLARDKYLIWVAVTLELFMRQFLDRDADHPASDAKVVWGEKLERARIKPEPP